MHSINILHEICLAHNDSIFFISVFLYFKLTIKMHEFNTPFVWGKKYFMPVCRNKRTDTIHSLT